MNGPITKSLGSLLLGAIASIALASCRESASAQGRAAAAAAPATVAKPIVETVALTSSYPAQVEAIERVELRPQVAGPIESIHFQEGARVRQGQLLVRIDPRPFATALAEAEAALAQARADARHAERESERAERLLQSNAVSQEEAERRRAVALATAARVDAARAAVGRARLDLSFTEVRSPITGTIGRAEITRGNLVSPQSRLAVIVASGAVYVRFDVDEKTIAAHPRGARTDWKVGFTLPGSSTPLPAAVAFVENEIAAGTGTLRVRAKLPNADGSVIPGMYGTATLTLGENPGALLVREEAIGADQGQRFVLVAGRDDVLEYRPVTLGPRLGDLRVVDGGLGPEDRVVVSGLLRLRPGTPVAPQVVPMRKEG